MNLTFTPLFWMIAIACGWNYASLGAVSLKNMGVIVSIYIISPLLAQVFQFLFTRNQKQLNYFSFRLMLGILLANIILFFLSIVSPFGVLINWALMGACLTLFLYCKRGELPIWDAFKIDTKSEYYFLLILPALVTFWVYLLLTPPNLVGGVMQLWVSSDAISHLVQIGGQARGHGIIGMPDFVMSHSQVHPYHYASYQLPALLAAVSNINALPAYASLLIPTGLMIFGLSGFVMGRYLFGNIAGLVCGLAILVLPDPVQQGFGNLFLGQVYWLVQGTPAMPYGIGCATLAFIFLFEAYKSQKIHWVLLAFLFAFFTLLYKAHLFVAIAWPIFVLPALFCKKYTWWARLVLTVLLTVIFFTSMYFSQSIASMPTLRLDGSGFDTYTHWLVEIQADGWIKKWITLPYINEHGRGYLKLIIFSFMVLLCSIGLVFVVYLAITPLMLWQWHKGRKSNQPNDAKDLGHLDRVLWFFPCLVGLVYLVMALGFALESRNIGEGEELQHRPFIWAYFIFTIWTVGATTYLIIPRNFLITQVKKLGLLCLLALLLLGLRLYDWPLIWKGGVEMITIPACQFQLSELARSQSRPEEIIQDSGENLEVSAISGRQNFIANFNRRLPLGYQVRQEEFHEFMKAVDPNIIESYLQVNQISWFIARPAELVLWDRLFPKNQIRECGGYRLFHFPRSH